MWLVTVVHCSPMNCVARCTDLMGRGGCGGELCSNQSGEGVVEGSCVVIRAHCPFNGYVYRAAYTSTILP